MSKPIFAQLDHDLHNNPKVRKAGRDGRDVFVFVLCKNASRGFQGYIPARYLEVDYLADQLRCSEEEAANGIARAIKAELIAIEGDAAVIVGWCDMYARGPMSDMERQRRHRATKGGAGAENARERANPADGQNTQEIQDHVTKSRDMSRGHECHASEKSREEKNRERARDSEPPADRGPAVPEVAPLRLVPDSPGLKPSGKRERRSPELPLPADWVPQFVAPPEGVDADFEFAKFRNWAEANDVRKRNWQAQWRNWLAGAQPRRGGTGPPQAAQPFSRAHRNFPT